MFLKHLSVTVLFFLSLTSLSAQDFYQIQNRWKSSEFIHVEQPKPASTTIQPAWQSAQWILEGVSGTGFYTIKNRWRGESLHIQNGAIECGPIQQGWWSAHWALEPVEGTSFVRIRNRWKPEVALHNQNGYLEAGNIELGWWSAHWQTIKVGGGPSTNQQTLTISNPTPTVAARNGNNPSAFSPEHGGKIEQVSVRYTDQTSIFGSAVIGSRVYFFPQEVVANTDGLSFDPKNPAIGGQTFTIIEINPKVKFDRPLPMMRNRNNDNFGLVVEIY
ncbi:hypothetical protein BH09BAC3_BH09BAC3_11070 [soil metagenome]